MMETFGEHPAQGSHPAVTFPVGCNSRQAGRRWSQDKKSSVVAMAPRVPWAGRSVFVVAREGREGVHFLLSFLSVFNVYSI